MAAAYANRRPIERMSSAQDLVSSRSFASPLAQLSLAGGSSFGASRYSSNQAANEETSRPPVPPLNLNLFRTPSVYSVDSLASLSTISADEHAFNTELENESPSTPRGNLHHADGYFALGQPINHPSPSASTSTSTTTTYPSRAPKSPGPLTPKRSFVITSRPTTNSHPGSPRGPRDPVKDKPSITLPRTTAAPTEHHVEEPQKPADLESIHGEQGSDWGEDEANFEWVDTDGALEVPNGDGKGKGIISPTKKMRGRIKSVVSHDGRKLRKNLVFPRRPPPPPPSVEESAPPPQERGPLPPRPGEITFPVPRVGQRPGLSSRWTDSSSPHPHDVFRSQSNPSLQPPRRPLPSPLMVPMRSSDGPSSANMNRGVDSRQSHLSTQSVAYSFYDIDSPGPSTPRASTPAAVPEGLAFPHGKYTKVSVSRLEDEREARERSISEPNPRESPSVMEIADNIHPETLLAKGIEARGRGDLPRSAWFFMKAAEGGSATGRMYWGLALRHGWGVARDERRAFAELRQACDESLAEGNIDFHKSPGANKLTLQQKKTLTRDLSLGMFEIANCFLEGVGAKKAPDVALSYLRFAANLGDLAAQEQLGFLLSKGGNGVKKDMKEAAKWYRMAISQGSTNTFGLAWVWKDKYM